MRDKVLVSLIAVVIVYVLVGAAVFSFMEKKNEQKVNADYINFKKSLLVNGTWLTPVLLKDIIKTTITAYDQGAVNLLDTDDEGTRWDMPSSVFFATTVITTIGYGHLSPATTGGRTFCVFFALFGIPLMLSVLSGIGEKLLALDHKLYKRIYKCDQNSKLKKIGHTIFMLVLGITTFIILPSIVFMYTDDWSFPEGVYYSFITLTTIGFGDYVAGLNVKIRQPVRIFMTTWIFVGLAWLSLLINIAQHSAVKLQQALDRRKKNPSANSSDTPDGNDNRKEDTDS